ncbi:NADH-quinone oxidoreductase subunit NuoG [Limnohabitans sp. Hippo3]|uniref:NADH-quinone oxidoreductase subunit NuoG n=1 Tax=Limnohabitans sp. Hippo3 TaxID=1597956 RepID=UPI000D389052|nr:NADH-quinone oxidoreductase subunit NuoG [Limnohabitans sp. Hippo3]PUE43849.1 NADH-quinone oxidoreductase subunit G [Limnohabitans sp. Hippo3]
MVEIELDGQKVEVAEGSMVMHAAEKAGTYIPHFCYHKKLSIAANCRMCLVEVEKAPKPMPACATPVTQGMIVRTKSDKAIAAQKSVMEFLLINHPLDCPICDQGGECQLQDLAVGYGGSTSRYEEEKRVVFHKEVGPLISMEEMSRCIHCTRCVRFGQEVAGAMELGMSHRGEHAEIETFLGQTIDSELSGNMIDICPVGALTSKPFRYHARTWELSRRKSVAAHDSSGANLVVQVKNNQVMRVVPLENEEVNECWIADRDRFSYEALNGGDRLTQPMLKQGGEWKTVDWQTALEYVANGLRNIQRDHGANSIGALVSPHSTLEELYLAGALMRGLGSDNIDHRLRHAEFGASEGVRTLGTSIASLSTLQRVLVVGSNLRKDHPLFALRMRHAVRHGAQLNVITSSAAFGHADAWAMPVAQAVLTDASGWAQALADVAAAIAAEKGVAAPVTGNATAQAQAIAKSLLGGERKAVLLGNAAAHAANASSLLALANWIAEQTGATVGYLTEAANTVGAQWVGAQPQTGGKHAGQMLAGGLKAAILLNTEPEFDSAAGSAAAHALGQAEMVVTLSPFKANMAFSDVLLPIAPFTETSGSFVNAEGRLQSFHAVVKPLAETRPAWKVLRVLANLLDIPGVSFETSQEVLARATAKPLVASNATRAAITLTATTAAPVSASIYQLDSIVRRAPSLQLTADARQEVTP